MSVQGGGGKGLPGLLIPVPFLRGGEGWGYPVRRPSWDAPSPLRPAPGPKQTFAINLFQEKMSFPCETSTIKKDAKYRSETKNIQFFSYNVYFVFQKIGNSQNILRKINFHIKAIKARIACLIFQ